MSELLQQGPDALCAATGAISVQLDLLFAAADKISLPNTLVKQTTPVQSPVTKLGVIATAIGLVCYVLDMMSDVYTAVQFGYRRYWWQCAMTLCIMYAAVAISTAFKWVVNDIHCAGTLGKLRYLASLLINWPDLQACWTLLRVEWQLLHSPTSNGQPGLLWQGSRVRVAQVKLIEGMCEACPQALLQLVLLGPELPAHFSWTVSMRMVATAISLCTAGAALVNWEKFERFRKFRALPLSELGLLHVWVVPVTVSRLLSLALLLSVHLYGGLACAVLHLVVYWVFWCCTAGVPRTFQHGFNVFQLSVLYLISPFSASRTPPSCALRHATHFLANCGVTVLWARSTMLLYTQPVLYVTVIVVNGSIFAIGLLGWLLHRTYFKRVVYE